MNERFWSVLWVILTVCAGLCGARSASAYPAGSNGWQANCGSAVAANKGIVCKAEVTSILRDGMVRNDAAAGGRDLLRLSATCRVLSEIKGTCSQIINVEVLYPRDEDIAANPGLASEFTPLEVGEVAILLLDGTPMGYELSRVGGKVRASRKRVVHGFTDDPLTRLMYEFIAGADDDDDMVRLQAAEELGSVGDAILRAMAASNYRLSSEAYDKCRESEEVLDAGRKALANLRKCGDPVIERAAMISSFQMDDSPGMAPVIGLLETGPEQFTAQQSEEEYGTDSFSIAATQGRLLDVMDSTARRFLVDLRNRDIVRRLDGKAFRGIRNFDYPEFCRRALACKCVIASDAMRRNVANIMWIRYDLESVEQMIQLLDDKNILIRSTVVAGLSKAVSSPFTNPLATKSMWMDSLSAVDDPEKQYELTPEQKLKEYQLKEKEYLEYWKKWWDENKDGWDDYVKTQEEELRKKDQF